jgi:transcription elongation factor GreB
MSKAFTRESDADSDDPAPTRLLSALPPGAVNYMTPGGARRLREEVARMMDIERPALIAAGESRKAAALDMRVVQIGESLRSAVIVPPPMDPGERDTVRLGANVTVRRHSGEARYRIVGADEVDLDRGWVSWFSPIARALLNARLGQQIRFRFPSGEESIEILDITYDVE